MGFFGTVCNTVYYIKLWSPQVWQKVIAAYHWVDGLKLPAG